ncbi:Hint domain-containing protein [Yoonia sp.]|uniref:Hint domain-containing protein n=1 Tax=Yoonia sp. TaxID=2212373 RepID=UPI0019DA6B5C|nr:Hint domain-containing protein [Yoonia sp.]MBE0413857.1 Hint domain-containing protein [Yoonia sp.]
MEERFEKADLVSDDPDNVQTPLRHDAMPLMTLARRFKDVESRDHQIDGKKLAFSILEKSIPCFTPGARVATPQGTRLVQDLKQGDLVQTRDNGIQAVVWSGTKTVSAASLTAKPDLRPVRIRAGALGHGMPACDMWVSPNHRLLVVSEMAELYFAQSEVLVPAKHMTQRDGIDIVDVPEMTYVHIMFEKHEVVLADGAWSESFQPGDETLKSVDAAQRHEILTIFPEWGTDAGLDGYRAARRILQRDEYALLI